MLLLPTFQATLRPCPISPAELTAHEKGHFCGHCQRVVQDFSQSENPIADLAAARAAALDGLVCGSFRKEQVVAPPSLTRRLKWFLLALVLVVGQGLTAREALAQVRKPVHKPTISHKKPALVAKNQPTEVPDSESLVNGMIGIGDSLTVKQPDSNRVYTYVEQMPELPGGGGNGAIVAFIQKNTIIPTFQGQYPVESRILFEFVVTKTGEVSQVHILKSLDRRVDAAVLKAVRQLPRFTPGRQGGVPIAVKYKLPITFCWQ